MSRADAVECEGRQPAAIAGWLMAMPALVGLVLFLVAPFTLAFVMSLTDYRLNSPLEPQWIGLENYRRLFSESGFERALLNNLVFAGVIVPLQTAMALGLALLVNQRLAGISFFRAVFFMPVIYPMALVSVVWAMIFAPGDTGLANSVLRAVTFGQWEAVDFFRDARYALAAIIVMSVWQGVGFQMVVMLAGLQGIPESLYEAARMDGARSWRRFVHVTLPQMRNTIVFVALVTSVLAFRLFDQIWILTQGGPMGATSTVMHEAFVASRERNQIGLGSAMTVVFFVIVCAIALAQHWFFRRERGGE